MDYHSESPDPMEGDSPNEGGSGSDWGFEEEGPFFAWLPPEDRLWRHPSEGADGRVAGAAGSGGMSSRAWSSLLPPMPVSRSTMAVALVAGLLGALAATGIGAASGLWPSHTTILRSVMPPTSSVSLAAVGQEPTNWTAIDDSISTSVVSISVNGASGPEAGSGLVLSTALDGRTFVVTDRSLFTDAEAEGYMGAISVTLLSGDQLRGKLVGTDPLSGLAVLSVNNAGQAVPAAEGSVADLRDADPVLAVGARSAAAIIPGSVSGEDRTVPLMDGTDLDGLLAVSMPSAASAAAGGPLLDQYGEVVGVTLNLNPVDRTDQQFTFAVPIDEVSRVATELIDGVKVTHPWLGISDVTDVPSVMAHQLGLSGGVQAPQVTSGSPAAHAGMQDNDIVTSIGGKPVFSAGGLVAVINACTPGEPVAVTYVHDGKKVSSKLWPWVEPYDG